jgi:hypothetical protein
VEFLIEFSQFKPACKTTMSVRFFGFFPEEFAKEKKIQRRWARVLTSSYQTFAQSVML